MAGKGGSQKSKGKKEKMVTEQQKHRQKEPSLLNPGHLVSEDPLKAVGRERKKELRCCSVPECWAVNLSCPRMSPPISPSPPPFRNIPSLTLRVTPELRTVLLGSSPLLCPSPFQLEPALPAHAHPWPGAPEQKL